MSDDWICMVHQEPTKGETYEVHLGDFLKAEWMYWGDGVWLDENLVESIRHDLWYRKPIGKDYLTPI